jgi:hypothetical protein
VLAKAPGYCAVGTRVDVDNAAHGKQVLGQLWYHNQIYLLFLQKWRENKKGAPTSIYQLNTSGQMDLKMK